MEWINVKNKVPGISMLEQKVDVYGYDLSHRHYKKTNILAQQVIRNDINGFIITHWRKPQNDGAVPDEYRYKDKKLYQI